MSTIFKKIVDGELPADKVHEDEHCVAFRDINPVAPTHVLVVPRAGSAVSLPALRQHLAARLERFKQPDAFHLAIALPLGRTGKADRGQFRALIEAGALRPAAD